MSTDIFEFETAAEGSGTVRAAFSAAAAECRPDIEGLTHRALDRGLRVRRHRRVGKAVGSAAAAAAIGLGTAYALSDSGTTRPANAPGSRPNGETSSPVSPTTSTSPTAPTTASPSTANAAGSWRLVNRDTLTVLRAAALPL